MSYRLSDLYAAADGRSGLDEIGLHVGGSIIAPTKIAELSQRLHKLSKRDVEMLSEARQGLLVKATKAAEAMLSMVWKSKQVSRYWRHSAD